MGVQNSGCLLYLKKFYIKHILRKGFVLGTNKVINQTVVLLSHTEFPSETGR